MVREILSISIGQAGIQLGQNLWQHYCVEHNIDSHGALYGSRTETIEDQSFKRFFEETNTDYRRYVPRNLMIDLEPNVIDDVLASKYKLFHPEFLLSSTEDAANNFARGHYSIGTEMIDIINDKLRKLIDNCDNAQGFVINHSVGGGTGSGLASLLLQNISVNYSKKSKIGFEIYPSPTISNCVVHPYNALLTTHWLLDHTDISLVLDNEAIYSICQKRLEIRAPSYNNLNLLCAKTISSITSSLRFESEINAQLDEFTTNLVPLPRLHFLITSLAPVRPLCTRHYRDYISQIAEQCFDPQNFFTKIADFDAEEDKYMAVSINWHGDVKAKEAMANAYWLKQNKKVSFVEWVPTGFKINLNDEPPPNFIEGHMMPTKRMCVMLGNNTAISTVFAERVSKKFDLLYSLKAFVHWYTVEGMEEDEFDEAREDLGWLEQDYLDVLCEQVTETDDDSD